MWDAPTEDTQEDFGFLQWHLNRNMSHRLMKNCIFLFLSLALAAFFTGCATAQKGILITTQRNPDFSPTRAETISMTLRPNPSPEDVVLGSALTAEMASEHFNIITNADANYTMTYLIEDDSTTVISEHDEVNPVLAPPPQSNRQIISGAVFGQPYSPNGTYTVSTVSTPLIFTDKGIRLYLYTNPKIRSGGIQIVWQGYIGGGRTVTPERIPLMVKTLLNYFGQDYTGRIDLTNSAPSPPLTH